MQLWFPFWTIKPIFYYQSKKLNQKRNSRHWRYNFLSFQCTSWVSPWRKMCVQLRSLNWRHPIGHGSVGVRGRGLEETPPSRQFLAEQCQPIYPFKHLCNRLEISIWQPQKLHSPLPQWNAERTPSRHCQKMGFMYIYWHYNETYKSTQLQQLQN